MNGSHHCEEHNCKFYKNEKDGREWYSHKIRGEDGYCNESETSSEAPQATKKPSGDYSNTNSSIEAQVAIKEVGENWRAGKLEDNSQEVATYKNWIMSKLSNWSSMGTVQEELEEGDEPKATEAQRKKIYATAKEKGYDDALAVSIMMRLYKVSSSTALSKKDAASFIDILQSGQYQTPMERPWENIEPESLPF